MRNMRLFVMLAVSFAVLVGVVPASTASILAMPVVAAFPAGTDAVKLSFKGPPGAAVTYSLSRAEQPGGPYQQLGEVTGSAYLDTGLASGRRYYYVARARSDTELSAPSAEIAVSPFTETVADNYLVNASHNGAQAGQLPNDLRVLWSKELAGNVSYPLIADGRVFVTVHNLDARQVDIWAFDAGDGSVLWGPVRAGAWDGGRSLGGIAYGDNAVFASAGDHYVKRINAQTGQIEWDVRLPFATQAGVAGPPVLYRDTLYLPIGGVGAAVIAMDVRTGSVRWSTEIEGTGSAVAVNDTHVYVNGGSGDLIALRHDGSTAWHRHTVGGNSGERVPIIADVDVYVRDWDQGSVLNADTGEPTDAAYVTDPLPPAFGGRYMIAIGRWDIAIFERSYTELVEVADAAGELATPAVAVGGSQFVIADVAGNLYRAGLPGKLGLVGNAGAPIIQLSERYPRPYTALAVAQGLVAVPATNRLTVFG